MPKTFTCYLNLQCTTTGLEELQGRQLCVFPSTLDITSPRVEVSGHVYTNDLVAANAPAPNCCPIQVGDPEQFVRQLKQRVGWVPPRPPPSTGTPGGQ